MDNIISLKTSFSVYYLQRVTDNSAKAGNLVSECPVHFPCHLLTFIICRPVASQIPSSLINSEQHGSGAFQTEKVIAMDSPVLLIWVSLQKHGGLQSFPPNISSQSFLSIHSASPSSMCLFKNGQTSCGVSVNQYIQLGFSLGGKFLNFSTYQISP